MNSAEAQSRPCQVSTIREILNLECKFVKNTVQWYVIENIPTSTCNTACHVHVVATVGIRALLQLINGHTYRRFDTCSAA